MTHPLYCPDCDTTGEHDIDGQEVVCRSCWTVRMVEGDVLASVVDMAYCSWCRETLPVAHECRPDETPCQSRTHLGPCGICSICLNAQAADLARRAEFEHGSPPDYDTP